MMRPLQIISAVRDRLGDVKKERWSDSTLILYVSMCQNDICMHTHLYRREYLLQLLSDQLIYELPTDFLALNRLEYRDEFFPIESRNAIDAGDATFPCALKDNLAFNELEIVLGDRYEDLTSALVNVYGVTSGSDTHDLNDLTGVVSTVDDTSVPPNQPLDTLKLYYTAVPPIYGPQDILRELIVPDVWFAAFVHYVCGMALQDDNDANNIERGELENQKYARLLANIMKMSSKDFTSNIKSKMTTRVRRI